MPREFRVYLEDLQRYLGALQGMTAGKSVQDFEQDFQLTLSIERLYEIVGEILRRMVAADPNTERRIDRIGEIIGFRNVLAHEYDKIEEERIWSITQQYLPKLVQQVNDWAAELGMEPPPDRA